MPSARPRARACAACMRRTARSQRRRCRPALRAWRWPASPRTEVARGHWLVAPEAALATDRFDAALQLWPARPAAALGHAGARARRRRARDRAVSRLLDDAAIAARRAPRRGAARAARADRGVARRPRRAARRVGHAHAGWRRVLDPLAPARYRRTPQRLAELDACAQPEAGSAPVVPARSGHAWRRPARAGRVPKACASMRHRRLPPMRVLPASTACPHGRWRLRRHAAAAPPRCAALRDHSTRSTAEELGPDAAGCAAWPCRSCPTRCGARCWPQLVAQGARRAARLRSCTCRSTACGCRRPNERIAQKVQCRCSSAPGFEGAWVRDLARDAQEPEALMRTTLARLAQRGELHQVVKDLYYPPGTIVQLAAIARRSVRRTQARSPRPRFRDATGLGRKRAIQMLEYFDRVGLLRRIGDVHTLRSDTRSVRRRRVTSCAVREFWRGKRSLVGRPGFKPGGRRHALPGGFDSHSSPPSSSSRRHCGSALSRPTGHAIGRHLQSLTAAASEQRAPHPTEAPP